MTVRTIKRIRTGSLYDTHDSHYVTLNRLRSCSQCVIRDSGGSSTSESAGIAAHDAQSFSKEKAAPLPAEAASYHPQWLLSSRLGTAFLGRNRIRPILSERRESSTEHDGGFPAIPSEIVTGAAEDKNVSECLHSDLWL